MPFNPFSILTSKIFAGLAALLLAALLIQTVRIEGALCREVRAGEKPACVIQGFRQQLAVVRIDLVAARQRAEDEAARHQATKRAYRDAQVEAARLEAERLQRITARQQEISDDIATDYAARLRDARARYERLRAGPTTGAGAGAGAAGAAYPVHLPLAPGAAGRAAQAPGGDGLSLDARLIATEQATQLEALIDWVERQVATPVN